MTQESNAERSDRLPDGTRLGRSALRVADREAMTEFYQTVVGLQVLRSSETTSELGSAERPLLVLTEVPELPERPRSGTGLYHNAFRVPSRAPLGDALARIRTHWDLDGASDHWVSEALYLTDPEGNGVEIYRDYPREEWPRRDDGRVRIGTERLDLDGVAAASRGDGRVPPGTDLGHVHLEVSSLDAFEGFYVDTLGFAEQTTVSGASFVSAGGYHHHVGANTWHRRTDPVDGRGLSWFEIVVPDQSALDAVRSRLERHGVAVTETDGRLVSHDPDGIEIRLRADSPAL